MHQATAACAERLESRRLLSVSMVKDINAQQSTMGYVVSELKAAGPGRVFISQGNLITGHELWKTDGTAAGTVLIRDIRPGPAGSVPTSLTMLGDVLFFVADDGVHGPELWRSDGTAAGTILVRDINPGIAGSGASSLVPSESAVFFAADDGVHGLELWKSDGTAAGTVLVKDVQSGSGAGSPAGLVTNEDGTVFFRANDGANGVELWKSDGTAGGTSMVSNLNLASASSNPGALVPMNGYVYFSATDGATAHGTELFRSNGIQTELVADLASGLSNSFPSYLTAVNGSLYFTCIGLPGGLWRTNGTPSGTAQVSSLTLQQLTNVNGTVFGWSGTTLYRATGSTVTVAQTGLALSIFDGPLFTNVNGILYFRADGGDGAGNELWRSDPASGVTARVLDIAPGSYSSRPGGFAPLGGGNSLVFVAVDPITGGALYRSDGTAGGTVVLKDVDPSTADSFASPPVSFGGALYFGAVDGVTGDGSGGELYRSDGTSAGTRLVVDLYPGATGSNVQSLSVFGDRLVFVATTPATGRAVWASDGTSAGTSLLFKTDDTTSTGGVRSNLVRSGGLLYFSAKDITHGVELWRIDGTPTGAVRLTDIQPGATDTSLSTMTDVGGAFFFGAGSNGLYKTDGSVSGTVVLKPSVDVTAAANLNGILIFAAGGDLYRSDGTAPGTVLVKDLPSFGDTSRSNLVVAGGSAFFGMNDGTHGIELWKSDGTQAGTVLVQDISSGAGSALQSLTPIVPLGDQVYFAASDGLLGSELWRSDGTAAGTLMVSDANPGAAGSTPRAITVVGGAVYFSADDGVNGREPWSTDGISAGAAMLDEVWPGAQTASDSPAFFTAFGGDVYFWDVDGLHGRELWRTGAPAFASIAGRTLVITGTASDDDVRLATEDDSIIEVTIDGFARAFSASRVDSVVMLGNGGEDTIDVVAGSFTFSADAGAGGTSTSLNVAAGAAVTFTAPQRVHAISANGTITLSAGAGGPNGLGLITRSLSLGPDGSIDLNDNDAIVDYASGDPSPLAAIRSLIAGARGADATWVGKGLTSSAARRNALRNTTVGAIEATDYALSGSASGAGSRAGSKLGTRGAPVESFDLERIDTTAILIKYTYYGDANFDGRVTFDDYVRIDTGFNAHRTGWSNGDFNLDGVVNFDDYVLIDIAFNTQAAPL